jgi:hypothetical protein
LQRPWSVTCKAAMRLSSLHSNLSAGIHGRTVHDLEMRKSLVKIAYDEEAAKKEAELLRKCTAASNCLAQTMREKPSRLERHAKRAVKLICGNTLLTGRHQMRGLKPQVKF